MDESLISVRYATALYDRASEMEIQLDVKDDMELILDVCKKSTEFVRVLESSIIPPSAKIKVLKQLFGSRVKQLTLNFLILTVKNRRESFIPSICRNVLDLIRKKNNIKTAVITTARPVDDAILNRLGQILEEELGGKIELSGKVEPGVIGGFVLRVDDMQYDATVTTQLKKLKKEIMNANY